MNMDIDLTEILKNCPRGAKFYSYIFGEDTRFMGVSPHQGDAKPIFIYGKYGEGFFRVSIVCSEEQITECIDRMKADGFSY